MKEVKVCGQCAGPLEHSDGPIGGDGSWSCPTEKCGLALCGTCSNSEVHFDEKGRCAKWWGANLTEKEVDERMQEAALENAVRGFADALEEAGYEDARELIWGEIVPLARQKKISLLDAAVDYSDDWAEQDTSWHQLHLALTKTPTSVLDELDINCPLG